MARDQNRGSGSFPGRRDFLKASLAGLFALSGSLLGSSDARVPSPVTGNVRTVLGDIAPDDLGVTLVHEHLLIQHPRLPRESVLDDRNLAVRELALFAMSGVKESKGSTLVEVTSHGLRGPAHAENLRYIAERTGVHVVMGTSFHKKEWHPRELSRWSQRDVEELIVGEILEGVGPAKVKAGIIGEVGISNAGPDVRAMDRDELKVLRASAAAQRRTGAAMTLHFDNDWKKPCRNGSWRVKVLEYLRDDEGVDPHRVIVGHFSPLDVDQVLHRRIIALGAYVAFDSWGSDIGRAAIPEEEYRAYSTALAHLIQDEQCLKKVLLSQDVCTTRQLYANGGCGYAHIVRDLVPRLRAWGVTNEQVRQMLVGNPRQVLTFA